MACQAMYTWSLSGLVGAFVDLSIAYLLLFASAIAYMASKFLGFFGLYLPCTCDGFLFVVNPNRNSNKIQLSVRSKFPFFNDSLWGNDQNCSLNLRLIGEKERDVIELEGEASCSSVLSDARKSSGNNVVRIKGELLNARNEVGGMELLGSKEGRFDMKGKEIMHQRLKSGIRHRRKWGLIHGKYSSSGSSYEPRVNEVQCGSESPPNSVNKEGSESAEDDIMVIDDEIRSRHDNEEVQAAMRLGRRCSNIFKVDDIPGEVETTKKNESGNSETESSRDDKHTIRLLEQALEEEQAAGTALYLELDKERSAATSAADEAMAMILRLQEEKALVQMEARQYQRMMEEKYAYDAEEMNILKEIIIRREREKHFLEKEVEAYHKMINLGDSQSTENNADMLENQAFEPSINPVEDPVLMLQQLSIAIDMKNDAFWATKESLVQEWDENATRLTGDLPQFSVGSNDGDQELKDKTILIDNNSCGSLEPMTSVGTLTLSSEVHSSLGKSPEENFTVIGEGKEQYGKDTDQGTRTSCNASDKEVDVHDVHVIVNQSDSKESMQKSNTDNSTSSNLEGGVDNNKSSSDMASRLPPLAPKGKLQYSHLQRNSMPALDNVRFKLDNEVARLRERLRIVQEGRKTLNLSVEPRERENLELKLLEDIAHQLQEIRKLKMPRKAVRQASLPLPSSKVTSKKRRCRSVSLGQLTSS